MRLCVPIPCFFGKMDFLRGNRTRSRRLGFDAAETYNWKSTGSRRGAQRLRENGRGTPEHVHHVEFRMTDPTIGAKTGWMGLRKAAPPPKRVAFSG